MTEIIETNNERQGNRRRPSGAHRFEPAPLYVRKTVSESLAEYREAMGSFEEIAMRRLTLLREIGTLSGLSSEELPEFLPEGEAEDAFFRGTREHYEATGNIGDEAVALLEKAKEYLRVVKTYDEKKVEADLCLERLGEAEMQLSGEDPIRAEISEDAVSDRFGNMMAAFRKLSELRKDETVSDMRDALSEARDALRELDISLSLRRHFGEASDIGTASESERSATVERTPEKERKELETYLAEHQTELDSIGQAVASAGMDASALRAAEDRLHAFRKDVREYVRARFPLLKEELRELSAPMTGENDSPTEPKTTYLDPEGRVIDPVTGDVVPKKVTIPDLVRSWGARYGRMRKKSRKSRP